MLDNSKNVVADEMLFTATNRFFKNMSNEDLMKWLILVWNLFMKI